MLVVGLSEHLPNPSPLLNAAWKWFKTHSEADERPEVVAVPLRSLQRQRRLSPEDEAAVMAAYQSGLSVYAVGAQLGIHRTSVSAIMRRHGRRMRRQ
jgi:DNA-directed RNA polymerase specialized sigma24 family protein